MYLSSPHPLLHPLLREAPDQQLEAVLAVERLAVEGAEQRAPVAGALDAFYDTVATLFHGGNFGGARVVARKGLETDPSPGFAVSIPR